MRVYFEALGCRLNEAEQSSWRREFVDAGYAVVSDADDAELVVLNTCAVTSEASRKSRKAASRLSRTKQSPRLIMTGCFSELEPEKARALAGVDLLVSNHKKDTLLDTVKACYPPQSAAASPNHFYPQSRTRAFIKVQDGCRNRCSFCIVTVARGEERSRSPEAIVAEINALHRLGHKEAVLTGVHLGGYGSDNGSNLAELVEKILSGTQIPRVRLSSLEPWDIPKGLWAAWRRHPRLCAHLHLPLQSGSDAVLKRMARRTSRESFGDIARSAFASIPDLIITTDIIVGFPGETEDDFADTMSLVEDIGFAHVHIFPYSARQGTAASRMSGQLPGSIKRERSQALHQLAAQLKTQCLKSACGQIRDVLWEEQKVDSSGVPHWIGFTDNYLRCKTPAKPGVDLKNQIRSALLEGVATDTLLAVDLGEGQWADASRPTVNLSDANIVA